MCVCVWYEGTVRSFIVVAPVIFYLLCSVMLCYVMLFIDNEHYPVYNILIACYESILKVIQLLTGRYHLSCR